MLYLILYHNRWTLIIIALLVNTSRPFIVNSSTKRNKPKERITIIEQHEFRHECHRPFMSTKVSSSYLRKMKIALYETKEEIETDVFLERTNGGQKMEEEKDVHEETSSKNESLETKQIVLFQSQNNLPLEAQEAEKEKTSESFGSSWTEWSAPTSLGSFLLKRKKMEEDEIKKIQDKTGDVDGIGKVLNKQDKLYNIDINNDESSIDVTKDENKQDISNRDDVADVQNELDETLQNLANDAEDTIVSFIDLTTFKKKKSVEVKDPMEGLDQDLVREVDESISIISASRETLMKDIQILSYPESSLSAQNQTIEQDSLQLPLSDKAHINRIGLDMRHLAVSIASTIEDSEQWKIFSEDGGGLLPLLECIRDGANEIEKGISEKDIENDVAMISLVEKRDEAFAAACRACRTLRDVCAISKPFASIVTDSILRTNAAWSISVKQKNGQTTLDGGLVSNLETILRFSQEDHFYKSGSRTLRNRGVQRIGNRKQKRDARKRCGLYVTQLLLGMAFASDEAVQTFRATEGLTESVLACSSYAPAERLRRRWIRYPIEVIKRFASSGSEMVGGESPFLAAASVDSGLSGQIKGASNQLLATIGHNVWYPKTPGQRGLRILCLDGGGTRGITAISSMKSIVQAIGGIELCDAFDMVVGTSTGAIIAFLVGLRRESSSMARKRYDRLIKRIFVKSALSTPMLLFTTASYDETPFNTVVGEILRDNSMLSSRADPRVPLVFAISSKMSSTPTQMCLFRNYNYGGGELEDTFVQDPIDAKLELGLETEDDIYKITGLLKYESHPETTSRGQGGSRHPGSFRVLQRAALRATTAAPTVFKPVLMGGELYCDGGIVASNPAAVAIHEARTVYPNVPIELVVSCGTGAFIEEKSAPRIGWDGIIGQIVNSATDGEQIHHILEDILGGHGSTTRLGRSSVSKTKYYRFNPIIGTSDTFPIDGTDPAKLEELSQLTTDYMNEPEQVQKLNEIVDILGRRKGWRRLLSKFKNT